MAATAAAAVFTVQAGPAPEGGYCEVISGTFEVGTSGTVTEMVPAGDGVPTITVNGVSTPPSSCVLSSAGFPCSVVTAIGTGVNEVSFTNNCVGTAAQGCAVQGPPGQGSLAHLDVVNYSLVSEVASTGGRSYITYRADLVNAGATIRSPLIARLTSLDPFNVQVMGQGELNFPSAPANSQVVSSNTFTILADPAAPLDFSKLSWAYYSRRSVPPRR